METSLELGGGPREARGPRGELFLGSLRDAWRDPLDLMLRSALEHGDVSLLRFPFVRYYVVADPEGIKHVLVSNAKNYVKSRNYRGLKILLGEGLLTAEGETWRAQRKLAQPAFHRERLASFVSSMAECTRDMLDRWDEEGSPCDAHEEMMRLTFRIVGRTLLSAEVDGDAKAIGQAMSVAIKFANDYVEKPSLPVWFPTPKNVRFWRARRTIEEVVTRIVEERRASAERKDDLLAMLMEARDEEGYGMSDLQLKHELLTLVLAGHETTANALTFILYLLSKHAGVLRTLEEEVATLGGRAPTLADLPRLAYATQVIEESLRLFPPAWVMEREAIDDDVVGGCSIPKGAIVGLSPWVTHRSPRVWPNPESFDPSRFVKSAKDARHKHAYLPFGAGPRTCIGNAFAMMEMQIALAMIVQRYRLELRPGHVLELEPQITLRPRGGLPMLRKRVD